MFRYVLLLGLMLTAFLPKGHAQTGAKPFRLGYTNQQLIFSFMPEAKQIETELRAYEQKLSESLNVKRAYLETKLQEYQSLREQGRLKPEEEEAQRKDLMKLQEEVQRAAEEAEQKLQEKSDVLLKPVQERIQTAIDAVAKEEGYTYIFNTSAGGTTIMLFGPAEDDVTDKVLKKLGITRPAPTPTPAPGTPAPGNPAGTTPAPAAPGTAPR